MMRFCLLELYILMMNVDLGLLRVVIFIIILSLKGKCIDLKFVDIMIVLLIYMIDHGWWIVIIVDFMSVHDWCINDDFVCHDRYFWRARIVNFFVWELFNMLFMINWFLFRLHYSIMSSLFISNLLFLIWWILLIYLLWFLSFFYFLWFI